MAQVTCWLIEKGTPDALEAQWFSMVNGKFCWDSNALNAIRFPTKEAADGVGVPPLDQLPPLQDAHTSTEHVFDDGVGV